MPTVWTAAIFLLRFWWRPNTQFQRHLGNEISLTYKWEWASTGRHWKYLERPWNPKKVTVILNFRWEWWEPGSLEGTCAGSFPVPGSPRWPRRPEAPSNAVPRPHRASVTAYSLPHARLCNNPKMNVNVLGLKLAQKWGRRGIREGKWAWSDPANSITEWCGPESGETCVLRGQEEHDSHLPRVNEGRGCEHRGKQRDRIAASKSYPLIKEMHLFPGPLNRCSKIAQTTNSIYFARRAPGCVRCSFGLGFFVPLRMGYKRSTVETCQCSGGCVDAGSCQNTTQTPFKRKIWRPQNPTCSAWSDLGRPSAGSPLRSKESWMLAGKGYGCAPGSFCLGPTIWLGCLLCRQDM